MSFTYNTSGFTEAFSGDVSVVLSGINVGDLIIAFASNQGSSDTAVSISDGTSSLTGATSAYYYQFLRGLYLLSSVASGTVTYTTTFTGTTLSGSGLGVFAFTPSSTPQFDVEQLGVNSYGPTWDTGNFSTTGVDELVFVGISAGTGLTSPSYSVAGSTATWGATGSRGIIQVWGSAVTMSSQSASMTTSNSSAGPINALSFKITGGSLNQYGFRFRNDNGSETTATWISAQNANP